MTMTEKTVPDKPDKCKVCDCPYLSWWETERGYPRGRCGYCGTIYRLDALTDYQQWEHEKPFILQYLGDINWQEPIWREQHD